MTKDEAVGIFGSKQGLCAALNIVRKTWWNWEDPLEQHQVDRIIGAHIRITEERDRKAVFYMYKDKA
jgi:hypothetical protein